MRIPLFKTNKEQSKRIIAKYSRINHEDYLEAAASASAKLYDRVPGNVGRMKSKEAVGPQARRASYVEDLVGMRASCANWIRVASSDQVYNQ